VSERDDAETRRVARERRLSRLGPGPLDRLAEEGRRLASERDDLVAAGVDPALLDVPVHPADWPAEDDQPGDPTPDDPEAEAARYADEVERWAQRRGGPPGSPSSGDEEGVG
jgi:hypothetical protein